jgi:hypothetical protein
MARGRLRVRTNARRETVFDVHAWSVTGSWPQICSSVCAEKENVPTLSPEWRSQGDADEIGGRLATGRAKGRVLYLIDQVLGGGYHVTAAALLHRKDPNLFRVYRFCFSAAALEEPERRQQYDSVKLVGAARALADQAGAKLEVIVPPRAKAGELCKMYGLEGGVRKDPHDKQQWMRSRR